MPKNYGVASASYLADGSGQIHLREVEAFHWDDDGEFFLVLEGNARHYELQRKHYTGQSQDLRSSHSVSPVFSEL